MFKIKLKNISKENNESQKNIETNGSPSNQANSKRKPKATPKRKGQTAEAKREYEREKKRRQRARMSEAEKNIKRQKDRDYNRNTRKKIDDLTDREKRIVRRQGKERSRRHRERIKMARNAERMVEEMHTPPPSDNEEPGRMQELAGARQRSGRRKKNRNRSKVYRALKAVQTKLEITERRANRYKKMLQRLKAKNTPSPNTKIKQLSGNKPLPTPVKKRLLFANELVSNLEEQKEKIKPKTEMYSNFATLVAARRLKKLRLIKEATSLVSYKMYNKAVKQKIIRMKRRDCISTIVSSSVRKFLEEDVNSRMCPGKRDSKTFKKQKVQKRILSDTMKNLHKKYNETHNKISYSMFLKHRPFYIVTPKLSDRDTCACIKHANMNYMIDKLSKCRILIHSSLSEVLDSTVCSQKNEKCMYGICEDCKTKKLEYHLEDNTKEKLIKYSKWVKETEERVIKEKPVTVKLTSKREMSLPICELIQEVENTLPNFKNHVFNLYHQFSKMKTLKTQLKPNEVIIHIDFSENYVLKYSNEEVQATHFGASQKQISLHTGVYYIKDEKNIATPNSFCTVSQNINHKAYAVWSHLSPVVMHLNDKYPTVDTYHFQSDGPTSQYRNKFNIYFLMYYLPKVNPNIKGVSWNYSVAGHGKGSADGVGGTLKRTADSLVSQGHDILTSTQFVEQLSISCPKIQLFEVSDDQINKMKLSLPNVLLPVKGITSLHQVTWTVETPSLIYLRQLSCFDCGLGSVCCHHGRGTAEIIPKSDVQCDQVVEGQSCPVQSTSAPEKPVGTGDFVAVAWDDNWYPGQIEDKNTNDNNLTVKFMARNGNYFIWPAKNDRQLVNAKEILCACSAPIPFSKRNFIIKEHDFIQNMYECLE